MIVLQTQLCKTDKCRREAGFRWQRRKRSVIAVVVSSLVARWKRKRVAERKPSDNDGGCSYRRTRDRETREFWTAALNGTPLLYYNGTDSTRERLLLFSKWARARVCACSPGPSMPFVGWGCAPLGFSLPSPSSRLLVSRSALFLSSAARRSLISRELCVELCASVQRPKNEHLPCNFSFLLSFLYYISSPVLCLVCFKN